MEEHHGSPQLNTDYLWVNLRTVCSLISKLHVFNNKNLVTDHFLSFFFFPFFPQLLQVEEKPLSSNQKNLFHYCPQAKFFIPLICGVSNIEADVALIISKREKPRANKFYIPAGSSDTDGEGFPLSAC